MQKAFFETQRLSPAPLPPEPDRSKHIVADSKYFGCSLGGGWAPQPYSAVAVTANLAQPSAASGSHFFGEF